MPEQFLTIEEVQDALQLGVEKVDELVQSGKLRRFLDGGVQKFRSSDVEALKQQAESGATVPEESDVVSPAAPPTLADTPSAPATLPGETPGADMADSGTAELPAAEVEHAEAEAAAAAPAKGQPEAPAGDKADVFDFDEDDIGLTLEEEEPGAVHETGTAAVDLAENVQETPVSAAAADLGESDVSDILADAGVDDDLETVGLDEIVGAGETIADEGDETEDIAEVLPDDEGSSAETALLGAEDDDAETVSLDQAEADTDEVAEQVLTAADVGLGAEEAAVAYPATGAMDQPAVIPWVAGNFFLVLAMSVLAVTGYVLICDAMGLQGSVPEILTKHFTQTP